MQCCCEMAESIMKDSPMPVWPLCLASPGKGCKEMETAFLVHATFSESNPLSCAPKANDTSCFRAGT